MSRRLLAILLLVLAPALIPIQTLRCEEPSQPEAPPPAPRTSRLQGTAILERNRPIAGATVLVRSVSRPGELHVTATNAKGAFKLDLPDGTYEVEFRREGLETVRKDKVELHAPFRAIVEVTMKLGKQAPPSTPPAQAAQAAEAAEDSLKVEGTAVTDDGAPVADMSVRFTRTDASVDPHEVRTEKDGTFEVDGLAPGDWLIESRGLAFLPVHAPWRLDRPTRVELVLVPQPAIYEPPPEDLLPIEEPIPPPG